ncbi:MAG TPA: VCBS repeat-containing protein [Candidatus Hydrogenedentes bacterium]|nr:VCBS repeat-containing protein [Candidatus Hydrogenedentota bacterium]
MIALVPILAVSAVVFVEQPIDDYLMDHFGQVVNSRYADMDGDGENDIITPTSVAFQRAGSFPRAQQTPLPKLGADAIADVWKNEIFVLTPERIEVLRWSDSGWQRTLSQPMTWPADHEGTNSSENETMKFERFLRDLDGDDRPEVVRTAPDGVHVYSRRDLFYEPSAVWPVFQRPVAGITTTALWPASQRAIALPTLRALGTVELTGNAVKVIQVESMGSRHHRVRQLEYTFDASNQFALTSAPVSVGTTNTVDHGFDPVRLNDDAVIDLLRVRIVGETPPPLSTPIVETTVSTSAGKSFFSVRSLGPKPFQSITDYNSDGRIDLVSETKSLVEGGIRETLVRGLTRKEVDLRLEVRLQNESGEFSQEPSFAQKFTIELDKPPVSQSEMFADFHHGRLLSLAGDFDGDGTRDAAIRDRPNRLVVRRGSAAGIASTALASVAFPNVGTFRVADIDGDGRSDLLIMDDALNQIVYLSRDAQP